MKTWDEVLADVALETVQELDGKHSFVDDATCECGEEIGSDERYRAHLQEIALAVLKRRLLPLLEAGQRLCERVNYGPEIWAWDAAKKIAEGTP